MKETAITIRNCVIGALYQQILKRILFLRDPEKVHDGFIQVGKLLGRFWISRFKTRALFSYSHPALEQRVCGIAFKNPIGLAAGFDKNAELTQIMPEVGFGFEEVGSVTGEPCAGNPGRHLWRLPKSKSLVVYYGLKNDGAQVISKRLSDVHFRIPIGISIAKTNCKETCDRGVGIADYVVAYRAFEGVGDYYTINVSCPNAYGGQPFHDKESLTLLLGALFKENKTKPVFVKISPDLTHAEVDDVVEVVQAYPVDGLIISNLTKPRDNARIKESQVPDVGGLSGKVVEDLANEMIGYVYRKTQGKLVIVGCGGVFSAKDAYEKIKRGASLVQLITGMIYQGPQVISEINQGLVKLLTRDGYTNISEAVGAKHVR